MQHSELLVATRNSDGVIYSWNAERASLAVQFKGHDSSGNGICKLGSDYVVAAQGSKHSLHIWNLHREQVLQRSITAEAFSALAASPGGTFLAGGSKTGSVYLWETTSGRLLQTWTAHYNAVTCLLFVGGSSVLLSGGEDTVVCAWVLPELLDPALDASAAARPAPLHAWSDHTLPITSLAAGVGEASTLVASASQDHTVKLRRLADGCLIRSVALPAAIRSILLDAGEQSLFAGGADGVIYEVALNGSTAAGAPLWDTAARSTAGTARLQGEPATFSGHSRAVTCLALLSPGHGQGSGAYGAGRGQGQVLVSGSEDGTVRVWDMHSRLPIQTISVPGKEPVTNLLVVARAERGPGRFEAPQQSSARQPAVYRAQPLAPFSKYQGTGATGAQRWEGAPAILAAKGPPQLPQGDRSTGSARPAASEDLLGLPASLAALASPACAGLRSAMSAEQLWEWALSSAPQLAW